MNGEHETGIRCEQCGDAHPTEGHPRTPITVKFADTPCAPRVDELESIRKERIPVEQALPGWETLSGLVKHTRRSRESLDTLIAPQRTLHPEWFAVRKKVKAGSIAEHYHPDLLELVEQQLAEPPPEDWFPATSFGPRVTRIATATARVHPELCRPFVAPDGPAKGQLMLYYSQEFLASMHQWVEEQRRREFPGETTRRQLFIEYGLWEPFPKPLYPEQPEPYGSAAAVAQDRDKILASIEQDLIEDAHRQHRAREATQKIQRDLERSRSENEEW